MDSRDHSSKYLFMVATITGFLFVVYLWLFFTFKYYRLNELGDLNNRLMAEIKLQKSSLDLSKAIEESRQDRDKLDLYFVTKETTGNLIEEIESLAKKSGVTFKLQDLSVEKEKSQSKNSFLRFVINTEGSFENVMYFMSLQESLPYRINVVKMSIDKLEADLLSGEKVAATNSWRGQVIFDLHSYINK